MEILNKIVCLFMNGIQRSITYVFCNINDVFHILCIVTLIV